MRAIICGGRKFRDWKFFLDVMDRVPPLTHIISGGATGADQMAIEYAQMLSIPCTVFEADWKKWGNYAGPIRNWKMIEDGKPDLVVAMPGGKGTANMVALAKAARIKVIT